MTSAVGVALKAVAARNSGGFLITTGCSWLLLGCWSLLFFSPLLSKIQHFRRLRPKRWLFI
jgi:hypothetical protein